MCCKRFACAAACANLEIWRDEDVTGRIAALSQKLGTVLEGLSQRPDVTNPRQCGTMIAFDVAADADAGYLADLM